MPLGKGLLELATEVGRRNGRSDRRHPKHKGRDARAQLKARCLARRGELHGRQSLRDVTQSWDRALGLDTSVRGAIIYRPIGQMPSRQDPRIRIVHAALRLFASRGYYNTGIADILRESGCRRGTLYYHFSSKEELGYAAVDESFRLFAKRGAASHLATEEHPIDRLFKVLDGLPSCMELETTGSLTAGVAARMAAVHEGFRRRADGHLARLTDNLVEILRKGVADGQIVDSVDPRQLAHVFMIVSQGSQFGDLLGQPKVMWEDARRWFTEYLNSLRR